MRYHSGDWRGGRKAAKVAILGFHLQGDPPGCSLCVVVDIESHDLYFEDNMMVHHVYLGERIEDLGWRMLENMVNCKEIYENFPDVRITNLTKTRENRNWKFLQRNQ